MKIQYCSDLHLEFAANNQFLKKEPIIPSAEILLLAGDIVTFASRDRHGYFFDFLSENFKSVFWLPGNHEYYGSDISARSGSFCEKIRHNVFLLNNQMMMIGDVNFIFSTLWSFISPINLLVIQQSISDFHHIRYNGGKITPYYFNQLHQTCKDFIEASLENEMDRTKTVVITHHVPTFLNYPKQYGNNSLNEAFAVELGDLIEKKGPAFWIYGHHHSHIPPFKIGNTQMITNQLGYVQYNEHKEFNNRAIIDL